MPFLGRGYCRICNPLLLALALKMSFSLFPFETLEIGLSCPQFLASLIAV
jgi:hypothetical protein